jgi:hypothetical protein
MSKSEPELNYLPTREGGIDQVHTHLFRPTTDERESCGACAQLANDFVWLRFNDAMAGRASEFSTVEEAVADGLANMDSKAGRTYLRARSREAAVA